MKWFDNTALAIVIIGAVNWGLIGAFEFNLVDMLFGTGSVFSKFIYILVGISGLYLILLYPRISRD